MLLVAQWNCTTSPFALRAACTREPNSGTAIRQLRVLQSLARELIIVQAEDLYQSVIVIDDDVVITKYKQTGLDRFQDVTLVQLQGLHFVLRQIVTSRRRRLRPGVALAAGYTRAEWSLLKNPPARVDRPKDAAAISELRLRLAQKQHTTWFQCILHARDDLLGLSG